MLALLLVTTICFAEPPKDLDAAEEKASRALVLYQTGDKQAAADLFLEAYRLSGRATPLRNAAKAYEESGRLEDALVHWSVYALLDGLSDDKRKAARAKVEALKWRLNATPNTLLTRPEPVPTVEPPPPSEPSSVPVGGVVLLSSGLAVAVVGGVLVGLAAGELGRLDDQLADTDPQGKTVGLDRASAEAELESLNTNTAIGYTLIGVGAAVAIGGAIWTALGGPPETRPSVVPTHEGALLMFRGAL